ncbi:MAG: Hsp20/alpha crystallin family protein [Chloroflexota bacterium]|nr:MAG: hypothetical protein B6243_02605 [Anaerolineaceae bacterium 4572_5.2]RLD11402.1 MAG: Hsp20/alpha crystallin family protein [Chloroflexota bacterium]
MYLNYRPLSIWREIDRLQRGMERVFDNYSSDRNYPLVNVWANEKSALITAELPGLTKDDIELNVLENTITLSGERKTDVIPEDAKYHRQERSYGSFTRTIRVPYKIDVDKVEAVFANGVIKITLPRAEEDIPKKIKVEIN